MLDANNPRADLANATQELDPSEFLSADHTHYAVIDIGSNSVRLVVYNDLGRAPLPRFNEKSLCGLGAGLDKTGKLAEDAMACAVQAVHRFCVIAEAMGANRIDIIATEAVRRATNGDSLIQAIKERSGRGIRLLSGTEEAHFATLGVVSGFHRPKGLVGDMGGGSLEVAEALEDKVGERSVSLPLGALPVEALLAELGDGAKRRIDEIMKGQLPPLLTKPVFFAVGGGWRALARAHMESVGAPLKVAHGYDVDAGELRSFAKTIWRMAPDKISALPGVSGRRARNLPAAALVMDRVLKALKPERVVFSALGVREGWLYSQLKPELQRRDPLIDGAQAFGLPVARVPAFAPALVRWTNTLFPDETADERRLRLAACALSDIAWADHADVKAQQCFQRIVHFPLIGLTHAERVFLAATLHARHGGKQDDPCLQPAVSLVTPSVHRRAQILGRTLQLGHRFSGSVPEILDTASLRITTDTVRLEIAAGSEDVPDSDAVQMRMKQLAKILGVPNTEFGAA
ncbi:Ppx/GppA phosphatase family protein [Skermanella stibiiresistens]|uniref:Ppx/GppA phosphatase family protein n=1 Tax=Skermanella stibiiresistens TaxID=913326 RepID=UPI0004B1245E|nr:Ppx/GppA phosphatase family protein [Skermanella stibiiresistens]